MSLSNAHVNCVEQTSMRIALQRAPSSAYLHGILRRRFNRTPRSIQHGRAHSSFRRFLPSDEIAKRQTISSSANKLLPVNDLKLRQLTSDFKTLLGDVDFTKLYRPYTSGDDPELITSESKNLTKKELASWVYYCKGWRKCLGLLRPGQPGQERRSQSVDPAVIFVVIMQKSLDMPCEGPMAKGLWNSLLRWTMSDRDRLETTIQYAEALQRRTHTSWPGLYAGVMVKIMQDNGPVALDTHCRLKASFPPTLHDYKRLFNNAFSLGDAGLAIFEAIYRNLPVHGIHDSVLSRFYRVDALELAFYWKNLLIRHGDGPDDPLAIKRLVVQHAQAVDQGQKELYGAVERRSTEELVEEEEEGDELRVPLLEDTNHRRARLGTAAVPQSIDVKLPTLSGLQDSKSAHETLSDRLCARLFATRIWSVRAVIQAIRAFGYTKLGPASFRELIARLDGQSDRIDEHLELIAEAGIAIDDSMFTRLIRQATLQKNDLVIRHIISGNLHPKTYDDDSNQERLLTQYLVHREQNKLERTRDVLLLGYSEERSKHVWANALLRGFAALGDRQNALTVLRHIQEQHLNLEWQTSQSIRQHFLLRRRGLLLPVHDRRNLIVIIKASQYLMTSGGHVFVSLWKEILKRLGMGGHLTEYQNLVLWLAQGFASGALRFSESDLLSQERPEAQQSWPHGISPLESSESASASIMGIIPVHDKDLNLHPYRLSSANTSRRSQILASGNSYLNTQVHNPLNTIFDRSGIQAVITWGFRSEMANISDISRASPEALLVTPTKWQWGLRLLKTLQGLGITIPRREVYRACQQRLRQVFNKQQVSNRKINRRAMVVNDWRARRLARYGLANYIRDIRKIWGHDIFDPDGSVGRRRHRNGRRKGMVWRPLAAATQNTEVMIEQGLPKSLGLLVKTETQKTEWPTLPKGPGVKKERTRKVAKEFEPIVQLDNLVD